MQCRGGVSVASGPANQAASNDESGVQYRLYFFDGARHITTSHEFFAANDAAAIETAEAWLEGRAAELWTRNRKVHTWKFSK